MTIRRCLFALSAPLVLLTALPALCAGEAAPIPPTPLSAMLRRATPLKAGVVLAVSADKVPLPPDAVLPGDTPTVAAVGALYGQTVQPFGAVTAVFPPTITVVYAPPETPDPYDGMPPAQVMQLLTKTFTAAQWKAFLSKDGVAYSSMTGDTQPALFGALFPGGHLKIVQDNPTGDNDPKTNRDLSGDVLTTAHLRLGYTVSLALQMETEPGSHLFANGLRPKDSPPRYFMMNGQGQDVDHEFGATVRATVPNTLKTGQMAYDAPALKAVVPLGGIKTVGELAVRIGLTTKREIYADARYESRPMTLLPADGSAPAADLLRALAVCVGGTYRQVGPAWVLTDDVMGLGTKHALWKAFEGKAAAMLPNGPFFSATLPADAPYTLRDIPFGDDPLAFTPTQTDAFWKKWGQNPAESSSGMMDVTIPFAQLSPAQQDAAELIQAANEKSKEQTTLEGTVMVQAEPDVQILLPAVDGPILIFSSYDSLLPYPQPTTAQQKAQQQRMALDFPQMAAPNAPSPPDFSQTLRGFTRRAARIAPKTLEETTQAFAALKALGFTEVWLPVVPNSGETDAALKARLTQAVAAGRKSGVAILPAVSLLGWQTVPAALTDLTAAGKPGAPKTVSPFAPAVSARLAALVRTVGSVPGLGGMVWEGIPPQGYETTLPGENISREGEALGYSQDGRLAYLRQAHADPVDLHDNSFTDKRAHVSVPGFDSDFNLERRLFTNWGTRRADTLRALLGGLAAQSRGNLLLLPPSNVSFSSSYGSWDDLRRPPPTVHFVSPNGPDGQPLMGVLSTEHLSSALVYTTVQTFLPPHPSDAQWKAAASRALGQAAKRGDKNVVLDLTGQTTLWQEAPKEKTLGKETPKKP